MQKYSFLDFLALPASDRQYVLDLIKDGFTRDEAMSAVHALADFYTENVE